MPSGERDAVEETTEAENSGDRLTVVNEKGRIRGKSPCLYWPPFPGGLFFRNHNHCQESTVDHRADLLDAAEDCALEYLRKWRQLRAHLGIKASPLTPTASPDRWPADARSAPTLSPVRVWVLDVELVLRDLEDVHPQAAPILVGTLLEGRRYDEVAKAVRVPRRAIRAIAEEAALTFTLLASSRLSPTVSESVA